MNCIKKVANLVLCGIAFVWFLEDDPLWIETYRVIHCAIFFYPITGLDRP